jgi:hypothetical protein
VTLPDRLLMPLTPEDRLYSGRWLREPREFDATMLLPPAAVPAPAATTMPALALPPSPSIPAPAVRSPAPAALPAAGVTRTGLPRRPTGDRPAERHDDPAPPSTPDPEAVRARLSSLASGIAAANQDPSRSRTSP